MSEVPILSDIHQDRYGMCDLSSCEVKKYFCKHVTKRGLCKINTCYNQNHKTRECMIKAEKDNRG